PGWRVGPRELSGPAAVLRRGPALRCRRPDRRRRPPAGPRDDSPQGRRAMTEQPDDPQLRGPARLSAPRVPVVRLNRRLLYIIAGALVVVVLAGLVALRAQGSRLAQDTTSHTSRLLTPAGERWFDKVPDREPLAQPASTTPAPAPALPPASPPAAKTLT